MTLPAPIKPLIVPYTATRALQSSSKFLLTVPEHHTASYDARVLSWFALAAFNRLPQNSSTPITLPLRLTHATLSIIYASL